MNFELNNVPPFYQGYIKQVLDSRLMEALSESAKALSLLLEGLTDDQSLYRYEAEKWSIKDILQHLIDAEKVFGYRALRFSRGDQTVLQGFDQNEYVVEASADDRLLKSLIDEFQDVRKSTIHFFASQTQEWQGRKGVSSGVEMSVEMLGYIISGHTYHHLEIIKQRYLT